MNDDMLGKFDVLVWCNFTVQTNLINEYIWSSVSVICCLTCISINKLNVCVIKINIILDDTSKENVRHGVVDEAILSLICNLEVYISKFFSKSRSLFPFYIKIGTFTDILVFYMLSVENISSIVCVHLKISLHLIIVLKWLSLIRNMAVQSSQVTVAITLM